MRYLVTGTAGFIGFHLANRLLKEGHEVIGLDGMTSYYDISLKQKRHALLREHKNFKAYEFMLEDASSVIDLVGREKPDIVMHLAAQAGVRYSLENPRAYVSTNIVGTFNVMEACRIHPVKHLMMASTSSVYGANDSIPFRETDAVVNQLTLYAASKQSTELMAHCYAHLWNMPTTMFRFFTVYGPWGRPDMAYFLFANKILAGKPIEVFNYGKSERDFTFVDDLVEGIVRLSEAVPEAPSHRTKPALAIDTLSPVAPFRTVNIGGGQPVNLSDFIDEIEKALGQKAVRELKPLPAGDVVRTFASADLLKSLTGYCPSTPISVGVPAFVKWYQDYYSSH